MVNTLQQRTKAALFGLALVLCVVFSGQAVACSMAIPPGKTPEQARIELNQWIKGRCEKGGAKWLGDSLTVRDGITVAPVDALRLKTCHDRFASEMNQSQISSCYEMNCDCGEGNCFDASVADGKCVNYEQWKSGRENAR